MPRGIPRQQFQQTPQSSIIPGGLLRPPGRPRGFFNVKLGTLDEINAVHEEVMSRQLNNLIDAKQAGAMNNTLRGSIMIQKLKLDTAKLIVLARSRDIELPSSLIPAFKRALPKKRGG